VLCLEGTGIKAKAVPVHEFAHLTIGGYFRGRPRFSISELEALVKCLEKGRWENTYAISNKEEYFAEAVHSFFRLQPLFGKANGVHNAINTVQNESV
jgi:alpha-glucosidase